MKKLTLFFIMLLAAVMTFAQEHHKKFSPEKFQADLESYITKEAGLSPQQASDFFPVYREMQTKQRKVFDRMRQMGRIKPSTDKECKAQIRQHDDMDLELKQIQQNYHNRFFGILPASKVYDVLKAEDRFYRQSFKGMRQRMNRR